MRISDAVTHRIAVRFDHRVGMLHDAPDVGVVHHVVDRAEAACELQVDQELHRGIHGIRDAAVGGEIG